MKRTHYRAWMASMLLCLLVACGTPSLTRVPSATQTAVPTPAGATSAPAGGGTAVRIGASLPLSGRFQEPGTATRRGYEVWATLVNESGGLLGRPVELVILDNATEQPTAVAQYEQLITEQRVDLVFGPFSSFLVIPTSEVAARHGYAFIEPAGGAPEVFNRGLTNLFFAQPAASRQQAEPLIAYLRSLTVETRPKTFAVVALDDPFTLGVMEQLKPELLADGLELVLDEVYAAETSDFSAIATQLARLDPDLIIGGTQQADSIAQIQAYRQAGYQPRGAYFTNGPSLPGPFREALGPATEGIFASISWFQGADTHQNKLFVDKYLALFGGTPTDIAEDAANGFTVGQVLQQAVEKTQSFDNAALIKELHSGSYRTIVGPLSFDEAGRPQGSFMLLQWQGDMFRIVAPPDRAQSTPRWPKPSW